MVEAAAVFLAFCLVGLASMAPSVTFGDAGEFTASAAVLGVAHAPGYPLQALAGKALGLLFPFGNWAYRTNLLSLLAGAAALAVLACGLRRAGLGFSARLGAVLFLGLTPLWRLQSGVTEVFALHLLLLSILFWTICGGELWSDRRLAALGLAAGLGLSNHHTLLLAVPAAGLQAFLERGRAKPARALLFLSLGLAAGLACYLYLPLRARLSPPLDWGHAVDWPRFLHVFLRRDYGSFSLTVEGSSGGGMTAAWSQLVRFFSSSVHGLGLPFIFLSIAGFFCWPAARLSRWTVLLWILMTGPFFLILGNPPFDAQTSGALDRFSLAPWMGLAVLAAGGLEALRRRAPAAAWTLLLLPVGAAAASPGVWGLRGELAAYDYGRDVLRSLPPRSVLYMDGGDDTFYTLAFLRYAQGMRPDLELHDRGALVFPNPYGPDFRKLSREAKERRRQEIEEPEAGAGRLYYSTLNDKLLKGYELRVEGLLRRPVKAGARPSGETLWAIYPRRQAGNDYRSRAIAAFYPVMRSAALLESGRREAALNQLKAAWELAPDALWVKPQLSQSLVLLGYEASVRGEWALAERAYRFAREIDPRSVELLLSLGVVCDRTGRPSEAEAFYREALVLDPKAAKAHYNLGAIYWAQGRWAESADAFEEALRLDPSCGAAPFAEQARRRQR